MAILEKRRVQFIFFIAGVIALSITAEKCRHLVGEEAASKSGQFTILNCFDGSSGTVACAVKEGVKLYFYNIRSLHVESRRNKAIETALADAVSQGLSAQESAKIAQKEGAKAAKLATQKAKRIIGPIISSGWDFFEALYFGGTLTEGFLRGSGTLVGTYAVGYIGEQRFGRFGYLVGSHLGSWVGGRIGLMVYDVVNGVEYLLQFGTEVFEDGSNEKVVELEPNNDVETPEDIKETSIDNVETTEVSEETTSTDESTWNSIEDVQDNYETYAGETEESFDAHEEL